MLSTAGKKKAVPYTANLCLVSGAVLSPCQLALSEAGEGSMNHLCERIKLDL
jgi:hypothetical protein